MEGIDHFSIVALAVVRSLGCPRGGDEMASNSLWTTIHVPWGLMVIDAFISIPLDPGGNDDHL